MRVAIYQCDAAGLTPDERVRRLNKVAKDTSADLLLCPELFMSGYNVGDDIHDYAESSDGPFAEKVADIAKATNTAIIYGYPEAAEDVIYNSAQCIDTHGQRLANHRKRALPPGFERQYFAAGEHSTLFELEGITFGLLICYESEFPEAVRACAEAGAHAILVPTASVRQWQVVPNKVIPARAFESGVYMVYANHAGIEGTSDYVGASCIVDPSGNELGRGTDVEEVITANIDVSRVYKAQERIPYLSDSKLFR